MYLLVVAEPVFGLGIGQGNVTSTTIRIPFYSAESITDEQYNVTDSHGSLYDDPNFMNLVDSNVTLVFHGYHRNIRGQTFVWNITESWISIQVNFSLSIWNDFGTSVYQFYWKPYSDEDVGEFMLAVRIRQTSIGSRTKRKQRTRHHMSCVMQKGRKSD